MEGNQYYILWRIIAAVAAYFFIVRPLWRALRGPLQPVFDFAADIYYRRGRFERDEAYHDFFTPGNVALNVIGFAILWVLLYTVGAIIGTIVYVGMHLVLIGGIIGGFWAFGPGGMLGIVATIVFFQWFHAPVTGGGGGHGGGGGGHAKAGGGGHGGGGHAKAGGHGGGHGGGGGHAKAGGGGHGGGGHGGGGHH